MTSKTTPEDLTEKVWRLAHNSAINGDLKSAVMHIRMGLKNAEASGFRCGRDAASAECERHAKFCKEEALKGGSYGELMARYDEAAYNAEQINKLVPADE